MTTSVGAPIWLLIIVTIAALFALYAIYQKGRKVGRREATWLQKMSIGLMQSLSGYPKPNLTVIPITEDNGPIKGNKNEYPECPEGFMLCVLLDDVPAEPSSPEEALTANLKIKTQRDYLLGSCNEFAKKHGVQIEPKEFDRIETGRLIDKEVKILNKIIFLKVDIN